MKKLVLALALTTAMTTGAMAISFEERLEKDLKGLNLSEFCVEYIKKHAMAMDVHGNLIAECKAEELLNNCIDNLKKNTLKNRKKCVAKFPGRFGVI